MRNNLGKKLLAAVLSLAMVLSLVGIQPASANAASYKISKKASMDAGTTATYNVTGVKKGQYIKVTKKNANVTVKYNGKNVKTSTKIKGTGKKLALKVSAKEINADYTNKMTVKVYSKKNKVVKTLTVSTKVLTQYVEEKELAIEKVEVASTSGKYVVAYFSKAFKSLSVADITIRNKNTNALKGVEKVALSSDGKTATITLVGEEGVGNNFLEANVDYVMTVKQNNESASAVFAMDEVLENVTITAYNAVDNTINVNNYYGGAQTGLIVPASLNVNYEDALGRTATVWYDKNNTVTKISFAKEEVVYGAFEQFSQTASAKAHIKDLTTGKTYAYPGVTDVTNSNGVNVVWTTRMIAKVANGGNGNNTAATFTDNTFYSYAKVILNGNGTVKQIVSANLDNALVVDKVAGDMLYCGGSEYNMKNFVIVKDGKGITTADIVAGDVVFFNSGLKFAEVYNNKKTSALTAVYTNKFAFDGKTYATTGLSFLAGLSNKTAYVDKNYGPQVADDDYMEALKAGGKDITVAFDRAGQAVFVEGSTGEVNTNTIKLVLTKNAAVYNSALKNYIQLTGWDESEYKTYTVAVEDLEFVRTSVGSYSEYAKKRYNKIGEIKTTASFVHAGNDDLYADSTKILDVEGDLSASEMVYLTIDEKGKVVGMLCEYENYLDAAVPGNNNFNGVAATSTSKFKTGFKTLDGSQLDKETPVYLYDASAVATGGSVKVTKITYGELKGEYAQAAWAGISYRTDGDDIYWLIIDVTGADPDTTGQTLHKVVVSNARYASSTMGGHMLEITVAEGAEITTYNTFDHKIAQSVNTGDVVTLTLAKDGKTVINVSAATASDDTGYYSLSNAAYKYFDFADGSLGTYALASTVTPTIVKVNADDVNNKYVEVISFADLSALDRNYTVNVWNLAGSALYVDTIVVTDTYATPAFAREQAMHNMVMAHLADYYYTYHTTLSDTIDTIAKYDKVAAEKKAVDDALNAYKAYKLTVAGTNASNDDFNEVYTTGAENTAYTNMGTVNTALGTAGTSLVRSLVVKAKSTPTNGLLTVSGGFTVPNATTQTNMLGDLEVIGKTADGSDIAATTIATITGTYTASTAADYTLTVATIGSGKTICSDTVGITFVVTVLP